MPTPDKCVKQAELETLAAAKDEIGSDQPEGVFARSLPKTIWEQSWMKPIERIVLVHRLREVVAQSVSRVSSRRRLTSRVSWISASRGPCWHER